MAEAGTWLKSGVKEEVPPQGGTKAGHSASRAVEGGLRPPPLPAPTSGTELGGGS